VTSLRGASGALAQLAELYGVEPAYEGMDGRVHEADEDTLVAVLHALGAPLAGPREAAEALEARRAELLQRALQPVIVHRTWETAMASVTLPSRVSPRTVWFTVVCEDGSTQRHTVADTLRAMEAAPTGGGARVNRYRFALVAQGMEPLGHGTHHLTLEWPGGRAEAVVLSAPRCPTATRGWGAFLPLHAVRTEHDWGVGSYLDLVECGRFIEQVGGAFVGCLPLYPAFLDPPADPSPYLPVSRLAYNEVFVDPTTLPELAGAPAARRLLESDAFRQRIAAARAADDADYEEVSRLRRAVLAPMAEALLASQSPRREELAAFFEARPELAAYARFRAARDVARRTRGEAVAGDEADSTAYHLYAQWVAAGQLEAAARATPLYADLPVGVHPEGFDPQWAPEAFAVGMHGGAPPDRFFAAGQDWAFPPLHPERMRTDGYAYLTAVLRRAFRHAACLRVDHVMGLQRLFWLPEGVHASEGVYVRYHADELHALVALEASRAHTVVVGEDLGTVAPEVRARMDEDQMLRSWVMQFESALGQVLPEPPERALASWGTHDLPRFAAYVAGDDIAELKDSGQLAKPDAKEARADRKRWRHELVSALGLPADSDADDADTILRGCLRYLAAGPAVRVLVDLEELWGARRPQNRPGTGPEAGNWRARADRTLAEAQRDGDTEEFLRTLSRLRGRPDTPGTPDAALAGTTRRDLS
jgi:4-alpha-glucanotransferase